MWVKICGVRDVETAEQLVPLRPDAIGLNFYEGSRRFVDAPTAVEIADRLRPHIEPVGVFADHSLEDVCGVANYCQLKTLQFHGGESPEFLARVQHAFPGVRIIRAYRVREDGCEQVDRDLSECAALGVNVWRILVDAFSEAALGGTGLTAPWDAISEHPHRSSWPPLILAGGLAAANIGNAIALTRPWGVDVASGVESSPGIKSVAKCAAFLEAARTVRAP